MDKNLFGISAIIASLALLVWSIGETFAYPQGPNVSLGSNPIVTILCSNSNGTGNNVNGFNNFTTPYQVPSGFDFIITDMGADAYNPTQIQIDNGNGYYSVYMHYWRGDGVPQTVTWNTGFNVPDGASVRCSSNGDGFISGYLAHQ